MFADVGGLENGLVNLINRLPEHAYRHAIVSLTEITDFRKRVLRDDVRYYALGKKPGQGFGSIQSSFACFAGFPRISSTPEPGGARNELPAWLAGVKLRVPASMDAT